MSLNVTEIQSLLRRAHMSARRGYQIALGDEYAQKLEGTDGSPTGLIELCQRALAGQAEPVAPPVVEDDGPPTWVPPAPVAPPQVESVEFAVAVESVETPDDSGEEEGSDADDEPEAEEPVEAEATDVAKSPAPKRSRRRRGK